MEFKNLYDMHTHSIHSFDGNDSCELMCTAAAAKKASGIAITDHCDIDGASLDVDELCSKQLADIEKCIATFNGIEIFKGIEIGQGIYRKSKAEYVVRKYDYDFVLGSLHNLENMEDFYFLDYKQYDVYSLLERYFDDLLELCEWGCFDSLAHLTYPLRYIIAREKINIDMRRLDDRIDAVLESLIKNKKALEINTSGLFMDMRDTLPNIEYVKRFRQLGGRYITVGSDSHYADIVLNGITEGYRIAKQAGFDYITIYKKHEPVLIDII